MGVRRPARETLRRLEHKTLDDRFLGIVRTGLGCSPFEAEAVLDAVPGGYRAIGTGREQPWADN
jgi:hypothetical protein